MAGTFSIKQNDTLPSIQEQLTLGGLPFDITAATVKFHLKPAVGGTVKVNATATIVTPASGVVRYDWVVADTDTTGDFLREWEVTTGSGKIITFPNDSVGYPVTITDDIA
jgi:hypothetical protein